MNRPPPLLSDQQFNQRAVRWAIILVTAAAVSIGLLWVLKSALTPLAAAFVLAYLLDPLIDRFEARRIPRSVAVLLLLGLMGVALAGFLLLIIPLMQREISDLAGRLPGYVDVLFRKWIPYWEGRLGIALPHSLESIIDPIRQGDANFLLGPLKSLLAHLAGFFTGTVSKLIGFLIIPVITFYFLVGFDRLKVRLLDYVPIRFQGYVAEKALQVDRLTAGFIRGQLTVSATLAVLYAVGYTVIGIDMAVIIGLIAGVLTIIPYVGNGLALGAGLVMAMLEFGFGGRLLAVVGWYAVVQLLESYVLTPRIVGETLGLNPVAVLIALMIGGDLLGFLGLLIAVPAAAILNVFLAELLQSYRRSPLYTGAAPEA